MNLRISSFLFLSALSSCRATCLEGKEDIYKYDLNCVRMQHDKHPEDANKILMRHVKEACNMYVPECVGRYKDEMEYDAYVEHCSSEGDHEAECCENAVNDLFRNVQDCEVVETCSKVVAGCVDRAKEEIKYDGYVEHCSGEGDHEAECCESALNDMIGGVHECGLSEKCEKRVPECLDRAVRGMGRLMDCRSDLKELIGKFENCDLFTDDELHEVIQQGGLLLQM